MNLNEEGLERDHLLFVARVTAAQVNPITMNA
jgi:hypothetical protein